MVSYYLMEVDGGETASFMVKTYTVLTVASHVGEKILVFTRRVQ
jgi:hypothetical protein